MAMTLHVDIVSAEAEVFSGTATMVFAPAEMGEVGIAPRHAPLLSRLKPGEVRVQTQEGEELTCRHDPVGYCHSGGRPG